MAVEAPTDVIVTADKIWTGDPRNPWAEAFAVVDGRIRAVGTEAQVRAVVGEALPVVRADGLVLPGFCDVHAHLGLGGRQLAWELPLLPTDPKDAVLEKVRTWAERLGPDEWVVGGIVGATVMDDIMNTEDLAALDAAAGGRPVLLRDDSMHNRWVSSRALELMGVGPDTPDPDGGTYVRDASGALTGVLHELACSKAEAAAAASLTDPVEYNTEALRTALRTLNSYGITAVQDAATMEYALEALHRLDDSGEITSWVVCSMPAREFIEAGTVGQELLEASGKYRSTHVRPDFVKFVLDGVPMTRTSAMLTPYLCHHHDDDPHHTGEPLWTEEELVEALEQCYDRGHHGKLHATGDAAVRRVLDAVETVRRRHGFGPIFHIAHVEYIDPADLPRFAELQVVPDASPYIWFPSVIQESIAKQIPAEIVEASWPTRDLLESGALLSAGSDWPCALPSPDPWTGLQALVTRSNPDPGVPGALNPAQSLPVEEAVAAFTRNPAEAMGLGGVAGMLREGCSADFIVVDQDLFQVAPEDIHRTRVLETWFEGRKVHELEAAFDAQA